MIRRNRRRGWASDPRTGQGSTISGRVNRHLTKLSQEHPANRFAAAPRFILHDHFRLQLEPAKSLSVDF